MCLTGPVISASFNEDAILLCVELTYYSYYSGGGGGPEIWWYKGIYQKETDRFREQKEKHNEG